MKKHVITKILACGVYRIHIYFVEHNNWEAVLPIRPRQRINLPFIQAWRCFEEEIFQQVDKLSWRAVATKLCFQKEKQEQSFQHKLVRTWSFSKCCLDRRKPSTLTHMRAYLHAKGRSTCIWEAGWFQIIYINTMNDVRHMAPSNWPVCIFKSFLTKLQVYVAIRWFEIATDASEKTIAYYAFM